MKKGKKNNGRFRVSNLVIIVTFLLFLGLIGRLSYLCLVNYKVGDSTIAAFIKNRNTEEEVIMPTRGTIYDVNGNPLANDVINYTIIAYLSDKRVDAKGNKDYVEDYEDTANKLASVLGVEPSVILEYLNKGKENNKYQIEFGSIGKNITELMKEEIDSLNLQGIDFLKDVKRYYPNGSFASYLIGYTVFEEDESKNKFITGEMGLEEYYNKDLKGKAGYVTYERDKYGYRIANGREYVKPAENGHDVYLTIDNNIQLFVENAVKDAEEESEADFTLMAVMDAKTGKILGYSSSPSFDPNLRDMTSYLDPMLQESYEPGSTMKVFSYMCAVDSGKYNGEDTYESGSKSYTSEIDDDIVTINDWNKEGWGTISYDKGFALSSNIAVANIVENVINKDELRSCYEKYGFGEKTGFTLAREDAGHIDFKYQVEVATAGYGQGITTTPLQHLKALSIIANNGDMVTPYVVDRIVEPDTGKVLYKGKTTKEEDIVKKETTDKMKSLMASVINGDKENSTGYSYHMDGYSLIGKTGTAQIFDYSRGKYMTGESDYIYSFSGMFPEENPEIIVYAAVKRPKDTTNYIAPMIKEVEQNITKYLNIEDSIKVKESYNVSSYINKDIEVVKNKLESNGIRVITLGSTGEISSQYPSKGSTIYEGDLVILKSNSYDKTMPNLIGYSYKEASNILKMMDINYHLNGTGYVYEQSIEEGTIIEDTVEINLRGKW